MTTCKYRIYGVTDTLQFGHIDDLLIYWNSKNYYESLKLMKIDINKPIINDTPVISEIFVFKIFECIRASFKMDP